MSRRTTPRNGEPRQPAKPPKAHRLVAGAMTGTSLDGIDLALVRVFGEGLAIRVEVVGQLSRDLGPVGKELRRLAEQQPMTAKAIAAAMRDFALLHLEALRELAEGERLDLVAIHGQTVAHAPPVSWQLFQPAPVALGLGVPVVHDLRAADLAAGGQGAPITPLADHVLFRHARESRTVINLGGFCNLTRLPAGREPATISGGDVCACNQVLDACARALLGRPWDQDGRRAMAGEVLGRPLASLGSRLALQARSRRSLGTGDELGAWLDAHRATNRPEDLLRTACAAIAATIAKAAQPADRLVVAGGGVRNRALLAELTARAGVPVTPSDDLGIPVGLREAVAMAVLGVLCQDRVPITLPQVTGVDRAPVAGCWTLPG